MKRLLFAFAMIFLSISTALASARETPVVLAVRSVGAAVVNVSTEVISRASSPFSGDPFFDKFFGDFFGELPGRERKRVATRNCAGDR